jgi:hypothetical protein
MVVPGGINFSPAFGGGGKLLLMLYGGAGTAPGCGCGGPSSSTFVVGVGCIGTYLWAPLVGTGIAGAPGLAAGYELMEDWKAVVVVLFVLGPLWVP